MLIALGYDKDTAKQIGEKQLDGTYRVHVVNRVIVTATLKQVQRETGFDTFFETQESYLLQDGPVFLLQIPDEETQN